MLGGTATAAGAAGGAEAGTEMASMMAANGVQAAAPTASAMTGASNPSMWSNLFAGIGNPNATKDGMLNLGQFLHGFTDQGAGTTRQGWENEHTAAMAEGQKLQNLLGYEKRVTAQPDMQKDWLAGMQTAANTGHVNALADAIRGDSRREEDTYNRLGGYTPQGYTASTGRLAQADESERWKNLANEGQREFDLNFGQRQTEFSANTEMGRLDQVIRLLQGMRGQDIQQQQVTNEKESGRIGHLISAYGAGAFDPQGRDNLARAIGEPSLFGTPPKLGGTPAINATGAPDEASINSVRSLLNEARGQSGGMNIRSNPTGRGMSPFTPRPASQQTQMQDDLSREQLGRNAFVLGMMPSYAFSALGQRLRPDLGPSQHMKWVDEEAAKRDARIAQLKQMLNLQ